MVMPTRGAGGGSSHYVDAYTVGGNGGSGVVILRYPKAYDVNVGAGLTASSAVDGDFRVTTFTAGTDDISFKLAS